VQVKLIGKNTLEETDKREGKVIAVVKMTVTPDGKSAKISATDMQQNRTTQFNAIKE
jgi:hypothetical protein